MISLFEYQKDSINQLKSGSILCGGVGSGKSITALAYYFAKECGGYEDESLALYPRMLEPKDLYIITTARKRDTLEWEKECAHFSLSKDRALSLNEVNFTVDSWNNIGNYSDIEDAFFIFDEQRVVGSGAWVKSFLKITKKNNWILLSATPGDSWLDYIPVFVANGFYKNRTDFLRRHVVFNTFVKYPKVDHYIETSTLIKLRKQVLVFMDYSKHTEAHNRIIPVSYDKDLYELVTKKRWNIFENRPVVNIVELCYLWRKIINSDSTRTDAIEQLVKAKNKLIVFYNFNYELELLRELGMRLDIPTTEWNGHKHELIPKTDSWLYLVQYTSGAEGWNCIETDTIVFYSQNYSYKMMQQAAGRIDRLNTPFKHLYYYHIVADSGIDLAIKKALSEKRDFNEKDFVKS